jgi:hypothetical protein
LSIECREKSQYKNNMQIFENVQQLKYLGMAITNRNLIQEEIKWRLNSGNACYYSAQNLSSSCLLSKNVKIRINRTAIFSCATAWVSLTFKEHGLRESENRVRRCIFGLKGDEVTEGCKNCIMRNFIICTLHHDDVETGEIGRACSTNGEKRNAYRWIILVIRWILASME